MRDNIVFLSLCVFTISLVSGCSGVVGSCELNLTERRDACVDFTGSKFEESAVESVCDRLDGNHETGSCSSVDRVGTCIFGEGTDKEYRTHYYNPPFSAREAEADCESTARATWEE